MKGLFSLLRDPIPKEMQSLLRARWDELPPDLRTDWQVVGRHLVHCGYTMGPSFCSFGCTHCYLPNNANRVPIPSLEEMKAQVDANRRLIGPGGGLQITGGDVVDAYWLANREEELIAVIRYATDSGVVPMLMTHGQILLENPDYLCRLIREGGLRKLAIHIDTTQAGRPGFPVRGLRSEADLHPLRNAFVDLIRKVRQDTSVRFFTAHTVTVTERNIDSIGEILRWLVSDPRNLDAFRTMSFQTEAEAGRTQMSKTPVTPAETWKRISTAVGADLPRDNLWFGHPDCSNMTTLMVIYPKGRMVNLIPSDPSSRAFWSVILRVFGGVGARGERRAESVLRKLTVLAHHPSVIWKAVSYSFLRFRQENLGMGFLLSLFRGQVRGFNIVLHNFIGQTELGQSRTGVIEKRLAACGFRGAMLQKGKWEAVPMCLMNLDHREKIYAHRVHSFSKSRGMEGTHLFGDDDVVGSRPRRGMEGKAVDERSRE